MSRDYFTLFRRVFDLTNRVTTSLALVGNAANRILSFMADVTIHFGIQKYINRPIVPRTGSPIMARASTVGRRCSVRPHTAPPLLAPPPLGEPCLPIVARVRQDTVFVTD